MVFENGVKSIQAAAYNGARTVYKFSFSLQTKKIQAVLNTLNSPII